MHLTHNQFRVANALSDEPMLTQREIAERTGVSLATVNAAYRDCLEHGLVDDGRVTPKGMAALKPYEVDNAVILAAGTSSRFAPISYERPKGLLKVRGEVLIERQIEQLKAAGIHDIVLVVGYKKESFFYLEDKYGVRLVINRDFAERNNSYSLALVRAILSNTYICSSDNYFEENPFERRVWKAYYAAEFAEGPTEEWCLEIGPRSRIIGAQHGGEGAWYMIGHAYFDRAFSERFGRILSQECDLPQNRGKLWEELFVEHVDELDMLVRRYERPIIHEFDALDDLRTFDPLFLENLDSAIFDNITAVLGCEKSEIRDVYPLKQGLTNLSCHFTTNEGEWVYRHPGVGTEMLVNRAAELEALGTAKLLGLDSTFVFGNAKRGWKISRFVPHCRSLDVHDDAQLKSAMEMARKLHESGATVARRFSFYTEGKSYEQSLRERGGIDVADYGEMERQATELARFLDEERAHGGHEGCSEDDARCTCDYPDDEVLCHNDFFSLNFLVAQDGHVDLIDWEYAGMSDYASDFGTFCVCDQLTEDEMRRALGHYFGRTPTEAEWRHNLAFVGLAGWCWYTWALLKEAEGGDAGEWSLIYYRYSKTYLKRALDLYRAAEEETARQAAEAE